MTPTADKIALAEASEQRYRENMVQIMRRNLFEGGMPEPECIELMQMLAATHIASCRRIEWYDIDELIEQLAPECNPLACAIIERAKTAGKL
jgi:hypothetical protein